MQIQNLLSRIKVSTVYGALHLALHWRSIGLAPKVENDPPLPNLHRLTPADHSLLREYGFRRYLLDAPAAVAVARDLAAAFAQRLDYGLTNETTEAFLAWLKRQIARRNA